MSRGKRKANRSMKPRRSPRGSKKHQHIKLTQDTHHHFWPKNLYGGWENVVHELSYDFHHSYHCFFMRYCKSGHGRDCHHGFCQFQAVCCYVGLTVEWGRRVK